MDAHTERSCGSGVPCMPTKPNNTASCIGTHASSWGLFGLGMFWAGSDCCDECGNTPVTGGAKLVEVRGMLLCKSCRRWSQPPEAFQVHSHQLKLPESSI